MSSLFFIAILLLAPAPRQLVDEPSLQSRILDAAVSMFATRYPEDVHRLAFKVLRTGGQLDAKADVRLVIPESAALPRAHLQARVHQQIDGQWKEKGWAVIYVSHFDTVAITTRALKKDEPLIKEDIKFIRIETTRFRGKPVGPAYLDGLLAKGDIFAKKYLSEERTIRQGDIRNAFDVQLGQSVIMTYRRDQFVLEFTCKARKPGFAGEEIKLFAPATNKTYRVRITGPGKADWLETLE